MLKKNNFSRLIALISIITVFLTSFFCLNPINTSIADGSIMRMSFEINDTNNIDISTFNGLIEDDNTVPVDFYLYPSGDSGSSLAAIAFVIEIEGDYITWNADYSLVESAKSGKKDLLTGQDITPLTEKTINNKKISYYAFTAIANTSLTTTGPDGNVAIIIPQEGLKIATCWFYVAEKPETSDYFNIKFRLADHFEYENADSQSWDFRTSIDLAQSLDYKYNTDAELALFETSNLQIGESTASFDPTISSMTVNSGTSSDTNNYAVADSTGNNYTAEIPYSKYNSTDGAYIKAVATSAEISYSLADSSSATLTDDGDGGTKIKFNSEYSSSQVIVTASPPSGASGEAVTYTVNVSKTTSLDTLTAKDSGGTDYISNFLSSTSAYDLEIPSTVTSITFGGSNSSGGTITATLNGTALSNNVLNMSSITESGTVVVKVTESDGTSKEYTLNITVKQADIDNTLSALTLKSGGTDYISGFSSSATEYTAKIPYAVSLLTLTATKNSANAVLSYSGINSSTLKLDTSTLTADGQTANDIKITVTAESGDVKEYTVHVIREAAETNNQLNYVLLDKSNDGNYEDITQVIAGSGNNIQLENDITYVKLKFLTSSQYQTLTLKSTLYNKAGTVTGATKTHSYTQSTTKEQCVTKDGIIGSDYYYVYSNSASDIYSNLTAYLDNIVYELTVTAQDGTTSTYTFRITRAGSSNVELSSLSIQELLSNNGTTNATIFNGTSWTDISYKAISGDTISTVTNHGYKVNSNTSQNITFTVEKADSNATAIVTYIDGNGQVQSISESSGTFTIAISALNSGVTQFTLKITAEDTVATKEYAFVIYKSSNEKTLDELKLSLSLGTDGTKEYTGTQENNTITFNVPYIQEYSKDNLTKFIKVETLTVKASTKSYNATISGSSIFSSSSSGSAKVSSGSYLYDISESVSFSGKNTLSYNFKVNAEDGTTTDYILVINRSNPSSASNLTSITAAASDGTEIGVDKLDFNSQTYNTKIYFERDLNQFKITVNKTACPYATVKLTYTYYPSGSSTTTTVTDSTALTYTGYVDGTGNTFLASKTLSASKHGIVKIEVTAEDGSSTTTYTFDIYAAEQKNTITDIDIFTQDSGTFDINKYAIAPGFTFDSETTLYNITIPYSVKNIRFSATTDAQYGTLSGTDAEGSFITFNNTQYGDTIILTRTIYVTSEAGIIGTKYTINIYRQAPSEIAELTELKIKANDGTTLINLSTADVTGNPISLSDDIYSKLRIDRSVTGFTVESCKAVTSATISWSSTDYTIAEGQSKSFTITVTAESGSQKLYQFTVTRANNRTDINSISAKTTGDFEELFNSSTTTDNLTKSLQDVSYSTENIQLKIDRADKYSKIYISINNSTFSEVTGDDHSSAVFPYNVALIAGQENVISIKLMPDFQYGDESDKIYTVKIRRNAADNTLFDLSVKNKNSDELLTGSKAFNSATTSYELTLSYDNNYIIISGTPTDSAASLFINGNETSTFNFNLNVGQNSITVYVKGQDGAKGTTYTIIVTRQESNKELQSLSVKDKDGTELLSDGNAYSSANLTYSVTVSYANSYVTVSGAAADTNASLYIADAERSTYKFNIDVGENTITVYVKGQDGIKSSKTYTITVTREEGNKDNTLDGLNVTDKDGTSLLDGLSFVKNEYNYTITLDKDSTVEYIHIYATVNTNNKTVKGDGFTLDGNIKLTINSDNKSIDQTFKIIVTPEYGGVDGYYYVTVQKPSPYSSDTDIDSVSLKYSNGDVISGWSFNKDITNQTAVTLAYDVSEIVLSVNAKDSNAIVMDTKASSQILGGTKTYTIEQGGSIQIAFRIKAQDGTLGTEYLITVNRESPLQINVLNNLVFNYILNGGEQHQKQFITNKNSSETVFSFRIDRGTYSSLAIFADVAEADKSYILDSSGNKVTSISLSAVIEQGSSKAFSIIVYAQDSTVTPKTYTITIQIANNITDFSDVSITGGITKTDGQALNITASKSNFANYKYDLTSNEDYYLTASSETINLSIIKTDANSKIVAVSSNYNADTNTVTLQNGSNDIQFKIIADDGITESSVYTVKIFRLSPSSDATLSLLSVKNGETELLTNFTSGVYEYVIKVNRSVTKVTISAKANYSGAQITSGLGEKTLSAGADNTFDITVKPESGDSKTYKVTVKVYDDDNSITALSVNGSNFDFDANTYKYTYSEEFAYNVGSVEIGAVSSSSYATISGTGTLSIKDGENQFIVYATAENGTKGQEYTIIIIRTAVLTDAFLQNLEVFDADTNAQLIFDSGSFAEKDYAYIITLDNTSTTANIKITATLKDGKGQTLSEDSPVGGSFNLGETDNKINKSFAVTVIAQDGITTKTYTITILKGTTLSSETGIEEVELTNSQGITPKVNENDWSFDSSVTQQTSITLNYSDENLILVITPKDSKAKAVIELSGSPISGNILKVSAGETKTFTFYIVAENTTEGQHYTLSITRNQASSDVTLKSLSVKTAAGVELISGDNSFSSEKGRYELKVTRSTTAVTIAAVANDLNAKVVGAGSKSINPGNNIFKIYVNAEDGSMAEYTISVTCADDDKTFDSVSLNGGIKASGEELNVTILKIDFDSDSLSYELADKLTFSTKTVNILVNLPSNSYAKAIFTSSNVDASGIVTLSGETTVVKFKITAEDGSVSDRAYSITIYKLAASSDVTLKSLSVKNGGTELLSGEAAFNGNTTEYNITISHSSFTAIVAAEKNQSGAVVTGDIGSISVVGGKLNIIKIYVTAEDGISKKTYTVNITAKDSDATLKNLKVDGTLIDGFASTVTEYTLSDVEFAKTSINISAEANSNYAIISGLGSVNLKEGQNNISVIVTAETGETKTYTITVARTIGDTNNYLSTLLATDQNGKSLSFSEGTFNKNNTDYNIVLDASSDITAITVSANAESNKSTVTGTGTQTLQLISDNVYKTVFSIKVTAQNGDIRTYTVNVIKSGTGSGGSGNSKDTTVRNNGVSLKHGNVDYYTAGTSDTSPILIPYDASDKSIVFTVLPNDSGASVSLTKTLLEDGSSETKQVSTATFVLVEGKVYRLSYRVTSSDGTVGEETSVYVKMKNSSDSYYLDSLTIVDNNNRNYASELNYSKDKKTYILKIAEDITLLTFSGIITDGTTQSDYNDVLNITSDMDNPYPYIIQCDDGNGNIINYVINIQRVSDDIDFSSIKVGGNEYLTSFSDADGDGVYELSEVITVDYNTDKITISAAAQSQSATVYISDGTNTESSVGSKVMQFNLTAGNISEFTVYLKSSTGKQSGTYKIKVQRTAADTNNNLSSLTVYSISSDGQSQLTYSPSFSAEITKYSISLTGTDVVAINIEALAASGKAAVSGTGIKNLKSGSGESTETFAITVTSESGVKKTYELTVTRNITPSDDITIDELSLIGNDGINYLGTEESANKLFDMTIYDYEITVPYNVNKIVLSSTNPNGAQITNTGTYDLAAGETKEITFKVVSKSGKVVSDDYTIRITREAAKADASLASLTLTLDDGTAVTLVQDGTGKTGFVSEIIKYSGLAEYGKYSDVIVSASPKESTSQVLLPGVNGVVSLSHGSNNISIKVTAEDGTTITTYTVVIKCLSYDNDITDITTDVGDENNTLSPEFAKNIGSYLLNDVPYETDKIIINVEANEYATIRILLRGKDVSKKDYIELAEGVNEFTIYAISENDIDNGSKIPGKQYTLTVTRKNVDTDSTLKSLVIKTKQGGETLSFYNGVSFSPSLTTYNIVVPEDIDLTSVFIVAEANSEKATVIGAGYKPLKVEVDGNYNNVLNVIVYAQDGSETTYTINIYRNDVTLDDDVTIKALTLTGSDGIVYLGTVSGAKTSFNPDNCKDSANPLIIRVPYNVTNTTLAISSLTGTAEIIGSGLKYFNSDVKNANGENVINYEFYLVSQSGSAESDKYYVQIVQEKAKTDNSLINIKINGVSLSGFSADILTYRVNIYDTAYYYNSSDITFEGILDSNTTAVIKSGNGKVYITDKNVIDGVYAHTIVVEAQDGTQISYVIQVSFKTSEARLKQLNLMTATENTGSSSDWSQLPTDTFEFSADKFEYDITIDKSLSFLKIDATTLAKNAYISYNNDNGATYELSDSITKIVISVRPEDGSETKTYTINVKKSDIPSSDASLKDLDVVGQDLTFSKDTHAYTTKVGSKVDNVDLSAIANDANATVEIYSSNGAKIENNKASLDVGKNLVYVKVTAEDGSTEYYTVEIVRDAEPDYLMTILLIAAFLLWLATALLLFFKTRKKDDDDDDKKKNNGGGTKKMGDNGKWFYYIDEDDK